MNTRPVARLNLLHMLPDYLARAGVPAARVFRAAGIRDFDQAEGYKIVSLAQVCTLLDVTSRILGSPTAGLNLGINAEAEKLGASGRALLRGRTLGECLQEHARLLPMLVTNNHAGLTVLADRAVWTHTIRPAPEGVWLLYEGAAAFVFRTIRAQIDANWRPRQISFPHQCRGKIETYEEFFGAPVRFGVGQAFVMDIARSDLALTAFNLKEAGDVLDHDYQEDAQELRAYRVDDAALIDALHCLIEENLGSGDVTIQHAARVIGIPPRSLQRQLSRQNMTFGHMVDEVRRARAMDLIGSHELSLTNIAMELGYSDAAHFVRAFKRWTGKTPSTFRRPAFSELT